MHADLLSLAPHIHPAMLYTSHGPEAVSPIARVIVPGMLLLGLFHRRRRGGQAQMARDLVARAELFARRVEPVGVALARVGLLDAHAANVGVRGIEPNVDAAFVAIALPLESNSTTKRNLDCKKGFELNCFELSSFFPWTFELFSNFRTLTVP